MALNLDGFCDELAVVLGTGGRANDPMRKSFVRWINQAFRKIAYAYAWDEMGDDQTVTTVAPYGGGTSDGTVTVTNNSTTLTGSGTTFTAAMEGRKFALTQGGAYYRLATYVSATSFTLAEVYAGTTASAQHFVIYQDEFDLLATTHSIEDAQVLSEQTWPPLRLYDQRDLDALDYLGRSTGAPAGMGACAEITVGTPRVRILPVPDAVYRLNVRYQKKWVNLVTPTALYTTQGLPEDVEELVIDRALRWAPRIEGSRRVMTDEEWRRALGRVWAEHKRTPNQHQVRRGIGSCVSPRLIVSFGSLS